MHLGGEYLTIIHIYAHYSTSFFQIILEKRLGLIYGFPHNTKADTE